MVLQRRILKNSGKNGMIGLVRSSKTEKTESGLIQILDKSVPNLASIMFLAEIKNRKILFTGDGLGQDVVDMLSKNAMLDREW